MRIRKWTVTTTLDFDEAVVEALCNVGVRDDDDNLNRVTSGTKYIVSGDYDEAVFELVERKGPEAPDEEGD